MIFLLIAAVLSALTAAVHIFFGTREVQGPLLASDMVQPARSTVFLSWHVSSVLLVVAALGLLWAGLDPAAYEAGVLGALGAAGCAVWSATCKGQTGRSWVELPQAPVFAAIAVFATLGLIT